MIDIDEEISQEWCVPPEGFIEKIEEVKNFFKKVKKKVDIVNNK